MLIALYPNGPVIPNVRAEQAAAEALEELTDEQFVRIVKAEADRREELSSAWCRRTAARGWSRGWW
ncbi:MAG TPA: hypothetical protein PLI95_25090 [Polyangiaceae bacterium]|nr:hypothetical protein [Polyangiaceae bacterium]